MKVTRTLNQIYSEFVHLRNRKEIVAQMALDAKLDGRIETFEKLVLEYDSIVKLIKELSEVEVTHKQVENKNIFDIDNSYK